MTYLKWHLEILKTLLFTLLLLLILLVYAVNRGSGDAYDLTPAIVDNVSSIPFGVTDEVKLGKRLFKANCATCHNRNMKDGLTGPPLVNALTDWAEFPKEDLYRWINNPMKLIEEEHPRATLLWKEWKPTEMTAFPNMTEAEIDAIFEYVAVISK